MLVFCCISQCWGGKHTQTRSGKKPVISSDTVRYALGAAKWDWNLAGMWKSPVFSWISFITSAARLPELLQRKDVLLTQKEVYNVSGDEVSKVDVWFWKLHICRVLWRAWITGTAEMIWKPQSGGSTQPCVCVYNMQAKIRRWRGGTWCGAAFR